MGHPIQPAAAVKACLVALLLFFALQIPARRYPGFHPDLIDGVRGLMLGVTIGAMIVVARRNGRRAA